MRKMVFVYGENAAEQILMNEINHSESVEFISMKDEDDKGLSTLNECWVRMLSLLSDDEEYGGVSVLPLDILQNTHLLNDHLVDMGRWVILDLGSGEFDVGMLRRVGHFYGAEVGGPYSGWLLSREYGTNDQDDIVSTSKVSPKASKGSTMLTRGRVWDGVTFNSIQIGWVGIEEMFYAQDLKISYIKSLMKRDENIRTAIDNINTDTDPMHNLEDIYLNAVGGVVPASWYINWDSVSLEESDLTKVSDAYILDGKWVSQETSGLNWLDWIQHCNETWDMQDSETRITVYSVD